MSDTADKTERASPSVPPEGLVHMSDGIDTLVAYLRQLDRPMLQEFAEKWYVSVDMENEEIIQELGVKVRESLTWEPDEETREVLEKLEREKDYEMALAAQEEENTSLRNPNSEGQDEVMEDSEAVEGADTDLRECVGCPVQRSS
ncbi:hypothetical protein OE88DRAFT_533975 [Heliocybe sulcata]|uniref:Uncharacterized protein n=1 Tax=Heliocybe sulcata TaxID=5364 RepID=A0A5C3MSP6_9AGAM|nr:hypothetical protein OE88DRAFT_533975 [Heliocybe sulcata]